MKKILILLIVSASVFSEVIAQASDTPVMQYWTGGKAKMNFNIGLNMLGAGTGTGTFGGVVSPNIGNGAAGIFSNPAELGTLSSVQFFFDTKLGISNNTFGLSHSDLITPESIKDGTDTFLEDTTTFILSPSSMVKYTEFTDLEFGQNGGFSSFGLAFPLTDRIVLGLGYISSLDLNYSMVINGLNTGLKTTKEVGTQDTDIDIILSNSIYSQLNLNLHQFSLGLGIVLLNKDGGNFSIGIAANKYFMSNRIFMNSYNDGMIVLNNSTEYYFNDPADPNLSFGDGETNDLYYKASGNFKDEKWALKVGAFFKPVQRNNFFSKLKFSLAIDVVPNFDLVDNKASLRSYQPKFFTGTLTGEEEEALDILIDSLDLAKPNLTVATNNIFSDSVTISLPSTLLLGVDAELGKHTLALNIVKYFGEYSYKFDKYYLGYKPSLGIRLGFDLNMPDKLEGWGWAFVPVRLLFLDLDGLILQAFGSSTGYSNPHYRIGGGLMFGSSIVEGFEEPEDIKSALNTALPTGFSLGRQYTILEHITIGTMLFGFPDLAMRFSFVYNF